MERLQARVSELERREAERKLRSVKRWCVVAVMIVVLVLIATPRVSAALRTLEQVSDTVQRYTIELKTLDPDKLQEVIRIINMPLTRQGISSRMLILTLFCLSSVR